MNLNLIFYTSAVKKNHVADFLSRIPDEIILNDIDDTLNPLSRQAVEESQRNFSLSSPPACLTKENGIWVYKASQVLFVPPPLRLSMVRWLHSSAQHIGITKT